MGKWMLIRLTMQPHELYAFHIVILLWYISFRKKISNHLRDFITVFGSIFVYI